MAGFGDIFKGEPLEFDNLPDDTFDVILGLTNRASDMYQNAAAESEADFSSGVL